MAGLERLTAGTFDKKPVLITGANGFIGSHLARRLVKDGASVSIFVRKNSNLFRIKDILSKLAVWNGDIRDYTSVKECIQRSGPMIIYHLAGMINVTRDVSLIDPMIDVNLKGTMNIVKAVIENRIKLESFVNTGSSEEYGDGAAPFNEEQREIPVSPYSASKVSATYFCQMLHKSLGFPSVTLRPFLTYGPGQSPDMFIPSLIKHCIDGKNFVMTKGDQTREFNYVDDIVDAYILAAEKPEAIGEIINIGNGREYQIKTVAEKIVGMMGDPIVLKIGALEKRAGEAKRFFCDNRHAKEILGWDPKVGLEEGLKKTIDWYSKKTNL
jgi:UDP-glucose 4-epimerase